MPASAPPSRDVFFDSNVVLYLADDDGAKATRTLELLTDGGLVSAHVLGEVTNVMRGKLWKRSWDDVRALIETVKANTFVLPVSADTQSRALHYAERYKLQYFDALHVASAVLADCATLWSEDMHSGLVIDGLTLRNPYSS